MNRRLTRRQRITVGLIGVVIGMVVMGTYLRDRVPATTPTAAGEADSDETSDVEITGTVYIDLPPAERPHPDTIPPVVQETPEAAIAGRVYDTRTGRGLDGLKVFASRVNVGNLSTTVTDEEGCYRFEGLDAGNWEVRIWGPKAPPGNHTAYVTLGDREDLNGLDFALDTGLVLSGIVAMPGGQTIGGAHINAHGDYSGGTFYSDGASEADGRFAFMGLEPGMTVTLLAWKDGYASSDPVSIVMDPDHGNSVRLVLYAESTISGTVVDVAGRPVTDAVVSSGNDLIVRDPTPFKPNVNEHGVFHLSGLRAGVHEIYARHYSRPSSAGGFIMETGSPLATVELGRAEHKKGVRLVLADDPPDTAAVSGVVVDTKGRPLEHVQVWLDGEGVTGDDFTDADGRFDVRYLPPGKYMAQVNSDRRAFSQEVAAPSSDNRFVIEDLGSIRGTVVDGQSAAPITSFYLARVGFQQEPFVPSQFDFQASYDTLGRFYHPASPRSPTRIAVVAPGYALKVEAVYVPPGETVDAEIRLDPGAMVSGVVVNPRNQPVAGAQVFVGDPPSLDAETGATDRAAAFTGPDGSFHLESVSLDVDRLSAFAPGYRSGVTKCVLGTGSNPAVTIRLSEGLSVSGIVYYAGAPVEGAGVSLSLEATIPQHQSTRTGPDGAYRFDGVLPGKGALDVSVRVETGWYRVTRSLRVDGQSEKRDISVAAGDTSITTNITGVKPDYASVDLYVSVLIDDVERHSCSIDVPMDGTYTLTGLPPGPATVSLNAYRQGGDSHVSRTVDLRPGEDVSIELDLDTAGQAVPLALEPRGE